MHTRYISILVWIALGLMATLNTVAQERVKLLVQTNKGKFTIELFNETPLHRDNFLRFVDTHRYDGTIFHRVIRDFMVQGGNVLSRDLALDAELPEDSISGTVPAEFLPKVYIHERGMLAAAREGDEVNPERVSSASQFYIVTGRYYTDFDLDKIESTRGWKYTPEQRQAYKFKGGAAHLDGTYTIFGRLIDGWKTIDKIQRVSTNGDDRPLKNIYIKSIKRIE